MPLQFVEGLDPVADRIAHLVGIGPSSELLTAGNPHHFIDALLKLLAEGIQGLELGEIDEGFPASFRHDMAFFVRDNALIGIARLGRLLAFLFQTLALFAILRLAHAVAARAEARVCGLLDHLGLCLARSPVQNLLFLLGVFLAYFVYGLGKFGISLNCPLRYVIFFPQFFRGLPRNYVILT